MALDTALLFYFVRDAIKPYSENFHIEDHQNPISFVLNGNKYSVHVSYVHDSGNARPNDDERRIQISRGQIEIQRERGTQGYKTGFIGFFEGGNAFVAWDPRHVFSLEAETVVSVYARQSQLAGVETKLAAVHSFKAKFLDETSFAIALPASALGFYLENLEHFHLMPSESALQDLMGSHENTFNDAGLGDVGEFSAGEGTEREKFKYERKEYPRDPRFKKWVLSAYEKSCCICGRQLGLVQAAHIIPHNEEDCPNKVTNGLAMCMEHHRLYDDALLLPAPGGALVFNQSRAAYLRQTGQGRGLDEIEKLAQGTYKTPKHAEHQPLDEYLQRGLDIRLEG